MSRKFRTLTVFIAMLLCFFSICGNGAAIAGDEPYLGEMLWVPYDFAPVGWAFCDGQLLSIDQNQALFSVLGNRYGGDGVTTFALPNMNGRVMVNAGGAFIQGHSGGEETHTLTTAEIAAHNHTLKASSQAGNKTSPLNNVWAKSSSGKNFGSNPSVDAGQTWVGSSVPPAQPHNNMMPYQTLNCIIAVEGIYPSFP